MRHAFLVIAHNNFSILESLLEILDNSNSTFFIHIDKRAIYNKEKLVRCVKKSKIVFVNSKKIIWGHFSQVDCELRLLRAASKMHFDYYHLISGVDMPLHTLQEMDEILSENRWAEYIHFDAPKVNTCDYDRIRYYHIMPGREIWKRKINGIGIRLQKLLKIDRLKNQNFIIQKGANWFSITDNLVQAIIRDEKIIRKKLKWSFCGDEIFLQTYVYNSPFRNQLASQSFDNNYAMCLRKIDWNRGKPYIYRSEDFEELISSKMLFARKFDENVDFSIVSRITQYLTNRKETKE